MELFDICDEEGKPTGQVVEREKAHALGICHRTAHIWVADRSDGQVRVLLQKRAADKDSFPGCYDTSSSGHIQAGDEPLESACRELKEELGINAEPKELCFIGTFSIQYESVFHVNPFRDNETAFVYLYERKVKEEELSLQTEEVESVKWFEMEEILTARKHKDPAFCVPSGSLEMLRDYLNSH